MPLHRSRYLKHTDLFLVRVWTEAEVGGDGNGDVGANAREAGKAEWHGRVQRVTDGEVRRFDNLQALTNLLLDMLSGTKETP
jgi:hypothetical protein